MDDAQVISALHEELNYYRGVVKEQIAIIDQLTKGPGEVEYIHPYDLSVIMNEFKTSDIVDVDYVTAPSTYQFSRYGKKYRQSVYMPAKTQLIR
jgi:hypothetical protein